MPHRARVFFSLALFDKAKRKQHDISQTYRAQVMAICDELPPSVIADKMNVSISTVRRAVARIRPAELCHHSACGRERAIAVDNTARGHPTSCFSP